MKTYLIAGLGNPGSQYELTRHNAGFLALDDFADHCAWTANRSKWQALYCDVRWNEHRLLLVKPQTFMNRSGESLAHFVDFYNVERQNILILYDDLDLAPDRLKALAQGGTGGHNGIRSIVQCLGTKDFARLKIGIGRPQPNEQPIERYVLSNFSDEDLALFNARLPRIREALRLFLDQGIAACMNQTNERRTIP
jgi:peptidyl-tRNA hydrolase, PTH1 family